MFIRVKKVKKRSGKVYEYAHLVRGIWRKRRLTSDAQGNRRFRKFNNSVHDYQKFLGRVYRFEKNKDIDFGDFEDYVNKNKTEDIYRKLIGDELLCRGFKFRKGIYVIGGLHVDLDRIIVHDGKSDVVIKLQDFSG